ncbi:hypothetical protein CVT24_002264, partial [Panaeolus cyanescens]
MPLSAFNPFRSHATTPQTTGAQAQDAASSSNNNTTTTTTLSSRSEDQISPLPVTNTTSSADSETPRNRDLDGIPLEEPPPYTPRPATDIGETTLEQGPNRPFQRPPAQPQPPPPPPPPPQPHPVISPQPTGWAQPQPFVPPPAPFIHTTGSSSSTSTSQLVRQFTNSLNS